MIYKRRVRGKDKRPRKKRKPPEMIELSLQDIDRMTADDGSTSIQWLTDAEALALAASGEARFARSPGRPSKGT